MRVKNLFFVTFIALGLATFTQSCSNNEAADKATADINDNLIPPLQERKGELAKAPEWEKTKKKINELSILVAQHPQDVRPRLRVAMIYLSEVRVTGNTYYYDALNKILDGVLAIEPNNFEATTFKSSVAMSLHQFALAKELATKARSINPDNAYVYGVLVDANVELGNYEEAVAMSDKMQVMKPSLESYSRASYLREIYGDYPGAVEAMKLAVDAGGPGSESGEWSRVALGDLYLNMGMIDSAKSEYETSLSMRPEFPNAEIGLAKVEKAKKNYDAAIKHTENAIRMVSEVAFVSQLGELYELKGDKDKAKEIREDVISLLKEGEKQQSQTAKIKHNANREFANAYLANKEYDKALEYAMNDYKLRPENIDANELVGWLLYLKGDYAGAKPYAEKSLRTNTRNSSTLYKAALVYKANNDPAKAAELMQQSRKVNPYTDQRILLAAK